MNSFDKQVLASAKSLGISVKGSGVDAIRNSLRDVGIFAESMQSVKPKDLKPMLAKLVSKIREYNNFTGRLATEMGVKPINATMLLLNPANVVKRFLFALREFANVKKKDGLAVANKVFRRLVESSIAQFKRQTDDLWRVLIPRLDKRASNTLIG